MLTQLKNGDWLDLTLVTGVWSNTPEMEVEPFVAIKFGTQQSLSIDFPLQSEAFAYRDELAKLVNEANSPAPGIDREDFFPKELDDEKLLDWVADRLVSVYHDPEDTDFIRRLRKLAKWHGGRT